MKKKFPPAQNEKLGKSFKNFFRYLRRTHLLHRIKLRRSRLLRHPQLRHIRLFCRTQLRRIRLLCQPQLHRTPLLRRPLLCRIRLLRRAQLRHIRLLCRAQLRNLHRLNIKTCLPWEYISLFEEIAGSCSSKFYKKLRGFVYESEASSCGCPPGYCRCRPKTPIDLRDCPQDHCRREESVSSCLSSNAMDMRRPQGRRPNVKRKRTTP